MNFQELNATIDPKRASAYISRTIAHQLPVGNTIPAMSISKNAGNRTVGAVKSYLGSSVHRAGIKGVRSTLTSKLGLAFLGYSVYQGYREGGIGGAVGEAVTFTALDYGVTAALMLLKGRGGSLGLIVAGSIAYGAARKAAIDTGKERYKKHAKLEMGTPAIDQFGTIATMRQRSVMALNNSRLNGMTALGNEAAILYTPYNR